MHISRDVYRGEQVHRTIRSGITDREQSDFVLYCVSMDYKKLMFAVRLPERGLEWYSRSFADAQDDKSGCAQDDKSGCVQEAEGDENRDGGR